MNELLENGNPGLFYDFELRYVCVFLCVSVLVFDDFIDVAIDLDVSSCSLFLELELSSNSHSCS